MPGFVDQATLEQRLRSQKEKFTSEVTTLRNKIGELTPLATAAERTATELAEYKTKLERIETRSQRTAQLRAAGLDESLLDSVEVLYEAARAAAGESVDLAFDSWLQDGSDPLLRRAFKAPAPPAAGPPAAGAPPPGQQQRRTPTDTGAPPPAPGKLSPEQLQAYYQSPEYRSMKPEERRATLAQHRAMYGNG